MAEPRDPRSSETRDLVSVERVIAAPAEKIFELIANPERHHDIDGSGAVRDAKNAETQSPLALGSEFGMSMHLGIGYSTTNKIIEFDDGKRIAWQTRPSGNFGGKFFGGRIWRYELEPATGGGTLVRESWDISEEKGPIKNLLRTGRSKAHTRAAMEKTLANMAGLVE
jgi:uncharacterized protein YndB with AHSA1/START domain